MQETLTRMPPISLDEMEKVRLLQRVDTKFLTTWEKTRRLLEMAAPYYYVQQIDGQCIANYSTVYFDTDDYAMYSMHQHGHAGRQKLRIRSYDDSGLHFLEVKTKDNHGKTHKKRIQLSDTHLPSPITRNDFLQHPWTRRHCYPFLQTHLHYDPETLTAKLRNRFQRITLVNRELTERLTIDTQLQFHLAETDTTHALDGIVVVELKRDGRIKSHATELLRQLRIFPHGFSKYCMGMALIHPDVRVNRFKPRLHDIRKLTQSTHHHPSPNPQHPANV